MIVTALSRTVPVLLLTSLFLQTGCSGDSAPPTQEETNLKTFAILVGRYRSANRGALPKDSEQLKQYAKAMTAEQLKGIGIERSEERRVGKECRYRWVRDD